MAIRISKNSVRLVSIPLNFAASTDVASSGTTNIGAAASNNVRITGTTTITAFDSVTAGIRRNVRFAAALTLTHNGTSLILPGGQNILTVADDTAEFLSLGSGNWICLSYKFARKAPKRVMPRARVSRLLSSRLCNFSRRASGRSCSCAMCSAGARMRWPTCSTCPSRR